MSTPVVAVVGASTTTPDHPDYREGRLLGRLLAEAGLTVASGGYGGLMEAVSEGAEEANGRVIGVTAPAVFPHRKGANAHVQVELPTATVTERMDVLIGRADAVVALPGSIGTFAELVVAWNVAYVARFSRRRPLLVVAVGPAWAELVELLAERLDTDRTVVRCVQDALVAAQAVIDHLRGSAPGD